MSSRGPYRRHSPQGFTPFPGQLSVEINIRRLVAQRSQIVQQMTRIKNRIHGVPHTNLIPPYDGELFSASGRHWLGSLPLEKDEMLAVRRYLADLAALAGSQIDLYFSSVPAALPYIKAGTLRALGVTSRTRVASASDIPTLQEAGLPGYEAVTWIGLVGPAGVPAPVVERLNREVSDILGTPEMKQRLISIGAEAFIDTPAEFDAYIHTEVKRWADVVKAAGLSPQ